MSFAFRQSLKIFILGILFLLITIAVMYKIHYETALNFQLENSKINIQEISQEINNYLIEKVTNAKTIAATPVIIEALSSSNQQYQSLSEAKRNEEIVQKNNQWMSIKDSQNSFILNYTDNAVAKYLRSLQHNIKGQYGEIFLTNKYGALVASTAKLTTFAHRHKYWWQGAFNEGEGSIYLDDRGYDDSVGGYVLGVVVPVKKEGEIIGILKVNLNILGSINTIILNSQKKNHHKIKLVRSGGLIVFEEGLEPLSHSISSELLKKIQKKSNDSFEFENKDNKFIVALSEIKITSAMEEYSFGGSLNSIDHKKGNTGESWLLLSFYPISVISNQTAMSVLYLWIFGIFSTLALAILSFIIGKRIAKPVKELIRQTKQVSKGDFDAEISTNRKDEIGLLAEEFNRMTTYLKESTTSLNKLDAIFNTAANGMSLIDTNFKIIEANETFFKMVGLSKDKVIGKNCFDIFPSKLCNTEDCPLKKLQKNKDEKLQLEVTNVRPDGKEIPTSKTATSLKDEAGNFIGIIEDFKDMTEYKRAMKEIEKSEANLRDAQRIANIGSWTLDLQTGKVEMFGKMFNLLGLKDKNEVTNVSDHEKLYTPESWRRFNEAVEKAINSGESYEIEMEFADKNAKCRYAVARGEAIFDGNENIIMLKGTLQDITERKLAEKRIMALKKRNQALLDYSPVCHKIVDLDFNLQYMSANGFKMLKLDQNEDLYGKPYPFKFFPEFFRQKMSETMKKVVEIGNTLSFEALAKDVEGNELWLVSTIIPVKEDNQIDYLTIVSADVTQRKRNERNKRRLEQKLIQAQKTEAIGNLAGGIAHDFNNLLTPIIGMSELLLMHQEENSIEHESLSEILNAGIRGSELVKQILAFSRQSEHVMVPTDIRKIIKEVLKLSRATIPSYIEIIEDIQSDCGLLMADGIQIHQVIMNIITNAYHAVEEAKGDKIIVSLREAKLKDEDLSGIKLTPGKYAILSITDTGNGIPPELMTKIFDPYFTTKKQGKGTGLGLAVVYGIIQEHKGDIKIYTELGKGTTFNVYLPIIDKSVKSHKKDVLEEYPKGNERVLLVDDELPIVKFVARILEPLGYSISKFTNSIEALDAFKANPDAFDIIISDMNMPHMAGDKLAREIKLIRPDIPYILCTGYSDRINEVNTKSLGITDILIKPIPGSEIAKKVREFLDDAKGKID